MIITLEFTNNLKEHTNQKSALANVVRADFLKLFRRGIKVLDQEGKLKAFQENRFKKDLPTIQCTITNDQDIQVLNSTYRGIDKSTDVLSFSYYQYYRKQNQFKTGQIDNLVGEIIISADTAKRQAKEHHKTLKQELQFLFVHGLLHIFDYDHEEVSERKIMFDLQDQILGTKIWREIIG